MKNRGGVGLISPQDFPSAIRALPTIGNECDCLIYFNETKPASHYGGVWEELPQGTFLMAAGSGGTAGQTGGSNTHSHSLGTPDDTAAYALMDVGIATADAGNQRGVLMKMLAYNYNSNIFMFIDGGQATFRDQSNARDRAVQVVGATKSADGRPMNITAHIWRRIS